MDQNAELPAERELVEFPSGPAQAGAEPVNSGLGFIGFRVSRFLSNPFIIRVLFFLIFSFSQKTLNQKGQKGTTQEARV